MKYIQLLIVSLLISFAVEAQTPSQIINRMTANYKMVKEYSASMDIHTDIPFIRMKDIHAKVFFKRPKKYKVKVDGIAILPKQNPNYVLAMLEDTTTYTAVKSGSDVINGIKTTIISIIPTNDTADLVLAKLWVDETQSVIIKSQITTKSNGTILIEHFYGENASHMLPDKLIFTVETGKFKLPRALVADINTAAPSADKIKEENKPGKITMTFTNYKVNAGVDDAVFK